MEMRKTLKNLHLNLTVYLAVLLIFSAVFFTGADMSCDSCGRECARACGTKHFRTCCFNYLRKRSGPLTESESTGNNLVETPNDALISFERKLQTLIRDSRDLQESLRQTIPLKTTHNTGNIKRQPLASDEFMELS